ncbi:MAG: hypothetical protein JJU06_01870 [Ectothiorhodospiraceae bacterium]|nr:hypothetical protein [Ectothiorhodospiraceae bacterium]
MEQHADVLVSQGREALRAGEYAAARNAFEAALEHAENPRVRMELADALWWLGDFRNALANLELAYVAFRRTDSPADAAMAALAIALNQVALVANRPAAKGWCARAAHIIQDYRLEPMQGHLSLIEAMLSDDPVTAETQARNALEHARRFGDPDLELRALSEAGLLVVAQGRVDEGIRLLDEAMAGALGGEGANQLTVVFTSCNMIRSCTNCADFERATEWIRASDRFTERHGCPFLYVGCRVTYGAVLVATGDWSQAEAELKTALEQSRKFAPVHYNSALAKLAELCMFQGRTEEADRWLASVEPDPATAVARARLQLRRGDHDGAAAIAQRWLRDLTGNQFEYAHLREVLGEAELMAGAPETAAEHGDALVAMAEAEGCDVIAAQGHRLQARAGTRPDARHAQFEAAISAFNRLGMPYETNRTRLYLAEALHDMAPSTASLEARAALATFGQLGATGEAAAAAALLRELGDSGTRPGPRDYGTLTRREQQVFALLGEGLTNQRIAERLFLSRRTVEHHVAHILTKLAVNNRAEAAALAARQSTENP